MEPDLIQQWIDELLSDIPDPTPDQAALLRRVLRNPAASSPATDAA